MPGLLVVGCGKRPKPDAVNLDMFPLSGVDVVHDLDVFPYPFEDEQFTKIEAEDVLEHVEHFVEVVNELGRVLAIGGDLWVRGPHCDYPSQAWADPTHKRLFAPRSFNGWDRSTHDGREYGHYFHRGKIFFKVVNIVEKNKGYEYILIREKP